MLLSYLMVILQEEADLKPKGMTFGDIRASLSEVAMELATSKYTVGKTVQRFYC